MIISRMFDDRIEIWGVGSLPEPLTTDDLKKEHKSVLRNPALARSFFLIKFIEQWGTGTNRIIEEISMIESFETHENFPKFEDAMKIIDQLITKLKKIDDEFI